MTKKLNRALCYRFPIKTEKVRGVQLSFPADSSAFIWALQHAKFVECDYARARHFFMKYGKKDLQDMSEFRRTGRQLLSLVTQTLDSMEVPFWISSGTCLGKLEMVWLGKVCGW